ncbi:MAG: class I SAM-dependent methyltransferase [Deltaproteobacteria bacterium]|nr:class I SAM-dependent methyltransferase [Deltaproteobacteria bacterium]
MKVNWPERIWVNSPVRMLAQTREALWFKQVRPLAPGGRCLEIGCGRGVGAKMISRTFSPRRIDAIDIDPAMIELAVRKLTGSGKCRIFFLVADAQHIPYGDACFDAVFNFGIIHHLEDWRQGIKEISRVLVKGGAFYFEEIYPPLYANRLFRRLLVHPTQDRFFGPDYRNALSGVGLKLRSSYRESRFGILGVAEKE